MRVGAYVLQVELELLLVRLKLVSQLVSLVVERKQALQEGQELWRSNAEALARTDTHGHTQTHTDKPVYCINIQIG